MNIIINETINIYGLNKKDGVKIMVWMFVGATVVVYGGVMKYVVDHVNKAQA